MQFAQISDRVEPGALRPGPIDISALPGTWVNSNPDTTGIARIIMSESNGKLSIEVLGIGPKGLTEWGVAEAALFASSPSSKVCAGFTCVYDFGFAEAKLQGMIMKGLLVLAQFHHFKDGSNRADYFVREYFSLIHGRH